MLKASGGNPNVVLRDRPPLPLEGQTCPRILSGRLGTEMQNLTVLEKLVDSFKVSFSALGVERTKKQLADHWQGQTQSGMVTQFRHNGLIAVQ